MRGFDSRPAHHSPCLKEIKMKKYYMVVVLNYIGVPSPCFLGHTPMVTDSFPQAENFKYSLIGAFIILEIISVYILDWILH